MPTKDLDRSIRELGRRDPRFRPDAYHFVLDALDYTLSRHRGGTSALPAGEASPSDLHAPGGDAPQDGSEGQPGTSPAPARPSNVSGARLLDGFRDLALDRFGALAALVLLHWGIVRTEDVGVIVFHMVDAGLLQKTPSDSLDDYRDVFELEPALDRAFEERLRSGAVRIPARRDG